ncbi:MAG TPA: hypothetical protein EYN18_07380 [Nitrospirales bacterium]|nr:hypothetical protein [Nitrospirales bacterium]
MEGSESPSEVVLTHWPGSSAAWDYGRARPFRHDTAIGLYYAPNRLPPGATRSVSFSYGLGTISSTRTKNARLSLMARGPFRAGGQFWVVALVQNPESGQQVRLELAKGLTFDAQHEATKELKAGSDYAQLSWLVQIAPSALGNRTLTAFTESDDVSEVYDIEVQPRDTGMTLIMNENVKSGRAFWVSAFVRYARDEQTVELTLPAEFKLREGHTTKTLIPKTDGYSRIDWLVEAPRNKTGNFAIAVKLLPDGSVEKASVHVQAGSLIE